MSPKRLLIITPKTTVESFTRRLVAKLLLTGLHRADIEWEFYQPWLDPPDLSRFNAAICWSIGFAKNNFVYHCKMFEEQCALENLPVINSVRGCNTKHSFVLSRWKQHNIPCAQFDRFKFVNQIKLRYPVILRVDGMHRGEQALLARDKPEAELLVAQQEKLSLADTTNRGRIGRLDLAIEFKNTVYPDGFFRKRRCYVVGDTVLPRQASVSRNWLVNLGSCEISEEGKHEHQNFRREGENNLDLVRRAGLATGSDITALDYTITPDNRYFFWDSNRHFCMTGDQDYCSDKIDLATGQTPQERHRDDELLGDTMAALVLARSRN